LTTRKVKIFGQDLEKIEWEPVNNLPNGVFELDGSKMRIYYSKKSDIRAIEILEPIEEFKNQQKKFQEENQIEEVKVDYNKWTVKRLKEFCFSNEVKVPSNYRKAEIVKLVEEFQKKRIKKLKLKIY
jgi:hypothetical protein